MVTTLQWYSNNRREEQKLITLMCNKRKKNEKTFWPVKKLPIETDISVVYPSRGTLIKETAFGKPNLLNSYTVVPALSQVLCPILKGAYLDPDDLGNLFKAVPRSKYLHDKIQEYSC